MTASHVSAGIVAALLLGCAQVWAQPGPPVRLSPPRIIDEAPSSPAAPPAETTRPTEAPSPAIEVSRPPPIATDSVGLVEAAQAGLPHGPVWDSSRRDLIERLIALLPRASVSAPSRDLAKRLLIVSGRPPADAPAGEASATAEAPPKPRSWVGLRAMTLLDLGDSEAAANLARLVPSRLEDDDLARALLDATLAAYDNSGACALIRSRIDRLNDAYWQKTFIFCQALANEHGRAQLGLSMLREQNAPDDAAFTRLIAALGGDTRSTVTQLPEATPLHLAMLRAARQNVPAELATSSDPLLLRMIAATPNAAAEPRLVAAERAEAFGSLPAEALAQLYDSVAFTPEQLSNALTFAQGERGPRGRAVLYRAAKAQTVGVARAEALQRSWRLARERGGYATAVRVTLPLLTEMPPSPELAFFAGDAVRALLFAGKLDEARRWRTLMRSEALSGNELAKTTEALLWPLLWLADTEERHADKTPLPTRFAAWRQAQEKLDAASLRGRSALLATLIVSSGERPDPAIIAALLPASLTRESAPVPNLGLWLGVGAALESGRVAETALFTLDMLGPEGAAGAAPHTIALVLDALRAAGLDADARALAIEAAIAAGL
jgi:hypothetical protein